MLQQRQVSDLKWTCDARKHLDEDHVAYLAALMKAGLKLPPITILNDGTVVDGRHRLEAAKTIELSSVNVKVITVADQCDFLSKALRANVGGAKPPTKDDITLVIRQMYKGGFPWRRISSELCEFLPHDFVTHCMDFARGSIHKERIDAAARLVVGGGYSVADAAKKMNVSPDTLKTRLGLAKGDPKRLAAGVVGIIARRFKALSAQNANTMKTLQRGYESGKVERGGLEAALIAMEAGANRATRITIDWRRRFEILVGLESNETAQSQPSEQANHLTM